MDSGKIYKLKYYFITFLFLCCLPSGVFQANTADQKLHAIADSYTQGLLDSFQLYAYFINIPLERHHKFVDNTPQGIQTFADLEQQL